MGKGKVCMVTESKEKVLVVIQLTGGNDFMNTIVPYTNEHYFDARKNFILNYFQIKALEGSLIDLFENYLPDSN